MYVCEWDMCWRNFVTFPWWLKNVKNRSKIALFSNERHFEIWFPKKRTVTFFWSKLSKLHKKDPILQGGTTFSLKRGETRTSHGPIPHPLIEADSAQTYFTQVPIYHPPFHHWICCSQKMAWKVHCYDLEMFCVKPELSANNHKMSLHWE